MSISRVRGANAAPLPHPSTANEAGAPRTPGFSNRPAVPGQLAGLAPRMARGSREAAAPANGHESEPASPLDRNMESQFELAKIQSFTSLVQAQTEAMKTSSAGIEKAAAPA